MLPLTIPNQILLLILLFLSITAHAFIPNPASSTSFTFISTLPSSLPSPLPSLYRSLKTSRSAGPPDPSYRDSPVPSSSGDGEKKGKGGFGSPQPSSSKSKFTAIPSEPRIESTVPPPSSTPPKDPRDPNDLTNLEVDSSGYTLYTDPSTGVKSRVFDSLVSYPSSFDIKVVGPGDDPTFRSEITGRVRNVAEVKGTKERVNGKWVSITMTIVVESSEVLYEVYRVIDEDDRVKFKF